MIFCARRRVRTLEDERVAQSEVLPRYATSSLTHGRMLASSMRRSERSICRVYEDERGISLFWGVTEKKGNSMLQKRAMPRSSTLGDHHTGNHTHRGTYPSASSTTDVSITVNETDESRGRCLTRLLTIGTCLLLIGLGIGVGIWTAM